MLVDVHFSAQTKMALDFSSLLEMISNENAMWRFQHFQTKCPILVMVKVFSKKTLSQSKIVGYFNRLPSWANNFCHQNGLKDVMKLQNCHRVLIFELIKAVQVTIAMKPQNIQGKNIFEFRIIFSGLRLLLKSEENYLQ